MNLKCLFLEAIGVWLPSGSHVRTFPDHYRVPFRNRAHCFRIPSGKLKTDITFLSTEALIDTRLSAFALLVKYIGEILDYFSIFLKFSLSFAESPYPQASRPAAVPLRSELPGTVLPPSWHRL